MHSLLVQVPDFINLIFNALDLLVVRSALLVLTVVGTWSLVRKADRRPKA
jgi:hypothetical protein